MRFNGNRSALSMVLFQQTANGINGIRTLKRLCVFL